jgi:ankyrin repeat protein
MASSNTPTLTADEIDDVLYFTRVNEVSDLQTTITELAQKYQCQPTAIVEAAVDPESGNSPLHYCAANGLAGTSKPKLHQIPTPRIRTPTNKQPHVDLFPVLAAYSPSPASLNRQNAQGSTPLHWAALNGHLAVVKQLVGAGADMWTKNEAGHLAMFEAERADKGDVVQYLLEAGGKDVERVGAEGGVSEEDMKDMDVEEDAGEGASGDIKISMGDTS